MITSRSQSAKPQEVAAACLPPLSVSSETGRLHTVIIGYADNFHLTPPETVNETQRRHYFGRVHPDRAKIVREYAGLRDCLEREGVTVLHPVPVPGVPDQISPRDIGFVVGDTLVLANMVWPSRFEEWRGLEAILSAIAPERLVRVPLGADIEGGDVMVHDERIYIGLGQRSSPEGARFIASRFPDFEVVPIELTPLSDGEDVVHLDCVFAPVGHHSALVYRPGFRIVPAAISAGYDLIDVTREEQQLLATNVLSVSPEAVISSPDLPRVNQELRRRGIRVLEVTFSETIKTGGSFHCGSMPLVRSDA